MAKLDLSLGTPILGIIGKSLDLWLTVYENASEERKTALADKIVDSQIRWQTFLDRFLDAIDGREEVRREG